MGSHRHRRQLMRILARQEGQCSLCGRPLVLADATRDHILPRSRGGSDRAENISAAHRTCNGRRGNKTHPLEQSLPPAALRPSGPKRHRRVAIYSAADGGASAYTTQMADET